MAAFFVNCDWGTTHFRLRAVRADEVELAAEIESDQGVARIAESGPASARGERFRGVLRDGLRQLGDRLGQPLGLAPVLISGMAGSSIGWHEVPYAALPLSLDGSGFVCHDLGFLEGNSGPRVILISGASSRSDVMRGEETQVLGLFQLPAMRELARRSLVIMPGTHSKHLRVESGRIQNFWTCMTGELFDVLGRHSILQYSVGEGEKRSCEPGAQNPGGDNLDVGGPVGGHLADFRSGVEIGAAQPLSAALFRVRTRQLLDQLPAAGNRAFLSGVLIGHELTSLTAHQVADWPIVLCAVPPLDGLYAVALDAAGFARDLTIVPPSDVDRLSALGQAILARHLSGFEI
jgi:2-dehydro-3-deoxygalactonokinase